MPDASLRRRRRSAAAITPRSSRRTSRAPGCRCSCSSAAAHLGGGACGSEGPAPGFVMNHCSHWTRFYGHPAYRDFALNDEGLRYVFPDENEGMIFDDGSSFIGFSASRVVDARHRPPGALGGEHRQDVRPDRAVLGARRRHLPAGARRLRATLEAAHSAATASGRRRRGARPIRSRSCSRSPTA